MNKFRMSVFDENDPAQMQEKLLVCFGMCAGFRGCMEHAMLKVTDVVSGIFPSDHSTFPDIEWWGLKTLNSDKTTALGMYCNYVLDCTVFGRFPVLPENPDADFGGTMKHCVEDHLPDSGITLASCPNFRAILLSNPLEETEAQLPLSKELKGVR